MNFPKNITEVKELLSRGVITREQATAITKAFSNNWKLATPTRVASHNAIGFIG
jgi:hypothetical protein